MDIQFLTLMKIAEKDGEKSMNDILKEVDAFIQDWEDSAEGNKRIFVRLKELLQSKPGVVFEFVSRPGVTYSLRAKHERQTEKPLFVLVDVIDEKPRWLSVCFYNELVTDPDEEGDYVPEGLLGEDALCFDLEAFDEDAVQYVEARIVEAYEQASNS